MGDALDLKGLTVIHEYVDHDNRTRKFEANVTDEPILCPLCGSIYTEENSFSCGQKFKKHDTRKRTFKDQEVRGYRIVVEINQRRYDCPECGGRFTEILECIEPNCKVTKRLFDFVGKEALNENFQTIADKHGIALDTVKRAFIQEVAEKYRNRVFKAPRILGIDEIYIKERGTKRKQPYLVLTDIENKRILEFTKGITKEVVYEAIERLEGHENVEAVTMDMALVYRKASKKLCPKAFQVVDRFHVIQKFNMALNTIRISIQKGLPEGEGLKTELYNVKGLITANREDLENAMLVIYDEDGKEVDKVKGIERLDNVLAKYPRLKTAYEAKELLRKVYECKTKYDANQLYFKWEQFIEQNKDIKEIVGIQSMINKMRKEVFAYFDGGYSNAYTECANSLIRRIVRDGNGYSMEVLRAKVLFGNLGVEKKDKVKYKHMNFHAVYFFPPEYEIRRVKLRKPNNNSYIDDYLTVNLTGEKENCLVNEGGDL